MSFVPIKVPILDLKPQYNNLKTQIHAAIDRVMESGAFIMGPDVKLFEDELAKYLGVKHAIGVNSGTDALVIGLRTLGIGEGDEVITTPFSFFATAESISSVGAKPVFVDIDSRTFNIDPTKIEEKITSKTKAIMPVHLYGQPAAMAQIMAIAQAHGLKVIEDCAQSFGARYMGNCLGCDQSCSDELRMGLSGKHTGTLGDVGAYSFFPSKNLGAYGDGGMIVTNDDNIAELARMLRSHGSKKKYHNEIIGYNSRLDTMQAAILRVKLPYIDTWNEQRLWVAKTYNNIFANMSGVITPNIIDGHVFHQYTIRVLDGNRDTVVAALAAQGIASMIYYPIPQDRLPVYQGQYGRNDTSDKLATEVLSLPMGPDLQNEDIVLVCKTIQTEIERVVFS